MGQRLVRAKTKIRDSGIRFALPESADLPGRLESVLECIYAAYGTAWEDISGADSRSPGLAEEALWLGRVAVELLPAEPEARGLLALMLHCEARRPARRDPSGRYIPLSAQDPARWTRVLAAEAEQHLATAARAGRPGRFQLEAAIQSAHGARAHTGRTDWPAIIQLYDGLITVAPTLGAHLGRAAALAETRGPQIALDALDALPAEVLQSHQPHWALRGHLLGKLGRVAEARIARDRALALSEDWAVREFLGTTVPDTL
jgi:RNA polymerase sigma-70 factor (ECF subfamily)